MTPEMLAAMKRTALCTVHLRRLDISVDLPALSRTFACLDSPSIIGANNSRAEADGFSYWAAEPKEILEFCSDRDEPFRKLQSALAAYKLAGANTAPENMFVGGWIGYFSYELGRYIEKLPQTTADDLKMPLVRLCFYDRLIAFDHKEKNFRLVALQMPHDTETPYQKLSALANLIKKAKETAVRPPCPADIDRIDFSRLKSNMDKDYYLSAVRRIKRYIYDGDVYQINFSQRFETAFTAEPIDLFHWQNHFNPSPYSAYMDAGDFQIVSASPEMFITVNDGTISTKPIKGTRPRVEQSSADAAKANEKNFNQLVASEKERAELNMIVDLERNDLVRICEYGTRKVVQPRTIEIYPTVYHAVATVAGKLRPDVGLCEILKAVFPGGSITGAPKIRAMEIIDETEPLERGVYTGSIGFIGLDGHISLNIAIRTIIIKDGLAYAQTGGGIVADSDPEAEWNETLVKARALIAGINSVQRMAYSGQGKHV